MQLLTADDKKKDLLIFNLSCYQSQISSCFYQEHKVLITRRTKQCDLAGASVTCSWSTLNVAEVLLVIRKWCHQVQSLSISISIGVLCVCLFLPDRPTLKHCCFSGAYGVVHKLLWNCFICKYLGDGIFSKVTCCRMEGWSLEGFNFSIT